MAYNFVPASSQRIHAASTPVTAAPLTISAWAYPDDSAPLRSIVSIGASAGSDRFALVIFSNALIAGTVPGGDASIAITAGGWRHCVGVFASSTSRTVYLNGTAGSTNTTSGAPSGANSINIGARIASGAAGGYFDGQIADVGVWNAALTADEITALSKGVSARLIRPQSLVFHAPLIRDLIDVRGGLTLTNTNTATVSEHPRIYA